MSFYSRPIIDHRSAISESAEIRWSVFGTEHRPPKFTVQYSVTEQQSAKTTVRCSVTDHRSVKNGTDNWSWTEQWSYRSPSLGGRVHFLKGGGREKIPKFGFRQYWCKTISFGLRNSLDPFICKTDWSGAIFRGWFRCNARCIWTRQERKTTGGGGGAWPLCVRRASKMQRKNASYKAKWRPTMFKMGSKNFSSAPVQNLLFKA